MNKEIDIALPMGYHLDNYKLKLSARITDTYGASSVINIADIVVSTLRPAIKLILKIYLFFVCCFRRSREIPLCCERTLVTLKLSHSPFSFTYHRSQPKLTWTEYIHGYIYAYNEQHDYFFIQPWGYNIELIHLRKRNTIHSDAPCVTVFY